MNKLRFFKRNKKYLFSLLVIFLVFLAVILRTEIRSVDSVRNEQLELAGYDQNTNPPENTKKKEENYSVSTSSPLSNKPEVSPKEESKSSQTLVPSEGKNKADRKVKSNFNVEKTEKKKNTRINSKTEKTSAPQITVPPREISDGTDFEKDEYETDPIPEGKPEPVNQEDQTVEKDNSFYVYLSIDVLTILDNIKNLEKGLDKYVPKDGYILKKTKVKCYQGETVWDVLDRECKARGINVQSSFTELYGSVYVEGINNLCEFSCGQLSGWMYNVNGWYPNYGCSRYVLVEGEEIQWRYTCNGLGEDVGCTWLGDNK